LDARDRRWRALGGCSDVEQHHVKVLKDYGGSVSFLDGPTWKYTGMTVTGTDYWDGRIWIDLPQYHDRCGCRRL